MIVPGTNTIKILVDNTLETQHTLPLARSPGLPKNYGGILRDIYIVGIPQVSVDELHWRTEFSPDFSTCKLSVDTRLKEENIEMVAGAGKQVALRVEVRDSTGALLLARTPPENVDFGRSIVSRSVSLQIRQFQLWSPANPALYRIQVTLSAGRRVLYQRSEPLAFVHTAIDSGSFILNGAPVRIRGVTWYESYGAAGPVASSEALRNEVLRIRNLGANAVRVVGMPPHPAFLDLCDRLGIMVFTEGPLFFVPRKRMAEDAFRENASFYYHEMVEMLGNHPCIAGWGLGTDLDVVDPASLDFVADIEEILARTGKPIYQVVNAYPQLYRLPGVDMIIREFVDEMPRHIEEKLATEGKAGPSSVSIVSLGYALEAPPAGQAAADGLPGQSPAAIQLRERQAYRLNRALAVLDRDKLNPGFFVSSLRDWYADQPLLRFGPREDVTLSENGLYALDSSRRIVAGAVKSVFVEGQIPKIAAVAPTSDDNPTIYLVVGLSVLLLMLFNVNRSRRFRGNLKRIFWHPHGFYTEIRENRKSSNWHAFLVCSVTIVSYAVVLSGVAYHFREQPLFSNFFDLLGLPAAVKTRLIWLIWNPGQCLALLAAAGYFALFIAMCVFKLTALLLGRSLPLRQFYSLISWVSANFVFMLPVLPIYYRIISRTTFVGPAIIFFLCLFAWTAIRMFRAARVVFFLTFFRTLLLAGVFLTVFAGGLGVYFHSRFPLFDYWPMFWHLLKARMI